MKIFFEKLKSIIPKLFVYELFASFCYCCWTFFQPNPWGELLSWYPAFTTGITVYVIIVMNNTTEVVHFNPAITLSFFVSGELGLLKSLWYILAQCIGGILAGLFTWITIGVQEQPSQTLSKSLSTDENGILSSVVKLYALDVPESLKVLPGLMSETVFSGFMCVAALAAVYNKTFNDGTGALMVGLNVFLGIGAGTKIGAGCLNPLRSAAPWLLHPVHVYRNWIFMVGPLIGAVLAGILYRLMFKEEDTVIIK